MHLVETERYATVEDYDRWSLPHRAFHAGLVAHAGERVLATVAQLADHADRYRRVYKLETPGAWVVGTRGHREIFEACVAGDEVAAADQLARHYARVALSVIALIAPEHEPAVIRSALRMAARVEPAPPMQPAPSKGPATPPKGSKNAGAVYDVTAVSGGA
jgi:DNA-binding GntR family transcriptional regulator